MRRLYVRNLDTYQHYKNRRPPWVKIHREMLDNSSLMALPPEARWMAVGMILLATESESKAVVRDEKELSRRLALTEKEVSTSIKALLKCGFLASSPLAGRKQNARLEVEREVEKEPKAVPVPSYQGNGLVHQLVEQTSESFDVPF